MKIALSGTVSTGKTTLVAEISKRFGIPMIPEFAREVANEMGFSSPRDLPSDKSLEYQKRILDHKIEAENSMEDFIEDRSMADVLAYFLRWNSRSAPEDFAREYVEKCIVQLHKYDEIVFIPHGSIPFERDGFRTNHIWYAYEIHLLIVGALEDNIIPYYKLMTTSLEDRVQDLYQRYWKS